MVADEYKFMKYLLVVSSRCGFPLLHLEDFFLLLLLLFINFVILLFSLYFSFHVTAVVAFWEACRYKMTEGDICSYTRRPNNLLLLNGGRVGAESQLENHLDSAIFS